MVIEDWCFCFECFENGDLNVGVGDVVFVLDYMGNIYINVVDD